MKDPLSHLVSLVRLSVTQPRAAAQEIMAMHIPMPQRWMAVALTSVLSALLLHVTMQLLPADEQAMLAGYPGPFESAVMQGAAIVLIAMLVFRVGQWRGGQGGFADALILMVWLQAVLLGIQALQILALLAVPFASDLLGLIAIALLFWLLTSFVAELHGFPSLPRVFVGILATFAAVVLLLAALLIIFAPGRA